jgi:hypothetical protein
VERESKEGKEKGKINKQVKKQNKEKKTVSKYKQGEIVY